MQLLTAKPVIYLINLSEKDYIRQKNKHLATIKKWVDDNSPGDTIIPLSVSFEDRLTRMDESEVNEECKTLGTRSALPKVITTMRSAMDLISFFTTGIDEVRQWTIRKGTTAPKAAGVIHGDFEKTFILVEVTKYEDLKELGDDASVKAAGKLMQKGKTYVVEPNDILFFRAGAAKA